MADNGDTVVGGPRPEDLATQHSPLSAPLSSTMRAAPSAGDRIGKYIVERMLGRGGMGIVVGARHETLDEPVAIKLLHPKATKDKVQVERFVREARATVRIKSEHVVRVLDAGADDTTGAPFIVMEYLEGRDLGHVLSTQGPMPMEMAVDYIIQICEAVGAAHALGIIHRDLKPSNFFLTKRADGSPLVKVLDFGISKAMAEEGMPDPRLTETQAVFGSPTYMSPEQIRSSKNVDPRSDVWSLGVALFELLTAKMPFYADNVAGLLASVVADPPLRLSVFVPDVPPQLEAVVLACLEKDASRRIASCAELASRLAPFATEEGAQLSLRVERAVRTGSSQSFPPPQPSRPSAPPLSSGTPPPPSFSAPPLSAPSAPFAFGTTGADLRSTTGAANFRTSTTRSRVIALGVFALVLASGIALGVVAVTRDKQPPAAPSARAESARSGSSGLAAAPAVEPSGSVATSSAAPRVDPVPTPSSNLARSTTGKPARSGGAVRAPSGLASKAGAGGSSATPAPPPPPPPPADLNSRF